MDSIYGCVRVDEIEEKNDSCDTMIMYFCRRKIAGLTGLGMILNLMIFVGAAAAQSQTTLASDPHQVQWARLGFEAKRILSSVRVEVDLKSISASGVETELIASPRGEPVQPAIAGVYDLKVGRTIEPSFGKTVKLYDRIWFNPDNAAAIQRVRLRRGKDDSKKTYRYTQQGVFRLRNEPKDGKETRLEPEEWSDRRENFYPFETQARDCSVVNDPAVLLYLISAAPMMQKTDAVSLCLFGKKEVHHMRLRRDGVQILDVHYREKTSTNEVLRKGRVEAAKIILEAQPEESGADKGENFAFLELKKKIIFYIDPVSRVPLRISGGAAIAGRMELNLREVVFKQEID